MPNTVDDALDTVQNYAEEKIHELCPEKNMAAELTSDNERALLSAGRSSAQLRRTIGSGVVLAGAEADEVWKEAQGHTEVQFIIDFLKSGKIWSCSEALRLIGKEIPPGGLKSARRFEFRDGKWTVQPFPIPPALRLYRR